MGIGDGVNAAMLTGVLTKDETMRAPAAVRLVRLAGACIFPILAGSSALAEAAPTEPACAAPNSGLPTNLAAWTGGTDMAAAVSPSGLSQARLASGAAAHLTLSPARELTYSLPPEKAPAADSKGGLAVLSIREAGTYRIALSLAAWIDVVKDGQFQTAIAHGHGPACTTIRKMVDFALTPGTYVLQISGAPEARIEVLANQTP
jgi:hypothetical protein